MPEYEFTQAKMRGDTPLTSRLHKYVLLDACTAKVTAAPELPGYLTALLV